MKTDIIYKHVALGGTFDHFHNGHKRIIDFAFHIADKVTIGITATQLIEKKKFQNAIEGFETRKENVLAYIESNQDIKKLQIIALKDIFGTTLQDKTLDAIIVTRESKPNAQLINIERQKLKLPLLTIVTIPFVKGDDNKIIRSQRIRSGIIDRTGKSYVQLLNKRRGLNLPPRLRELLRKPLGVIIEGEAAYTKFTGEKVIKWIERNKPTMVISVGDVVTDSLLQNKYTPDLQIIDQRTQRKIITKIKNKSISSIKNPPGTLQRASVKAIQIKINSITETGMPAKIFIQG
jgi:pantetheine-phosphate adenylyltransferase